MAVKMKEHDSMTPLTRDGPQCLGVSGHGSFLGRVAYAAAPRPKLHQLNSAENASTPSTHGAEGGVRSGAFGQEGEAIKQTASQGELFLRFFAHCKRKHTGGFQLSAALGGLSDG